MHSAGMLVSALTLESSEATSPSGIEECGTVKLQVVFVWLHCKALGSYCFTACKLFSILFNLFLNFRDRIDIILA